jgi:hypothetical protein
VELASNDEKSLGSVGEAGGEARETAEQVVPALSLASKDGETHSGGRPVRQHVQHGPPVALPELLCNVLRLLPQLILQQPCTFPVWYRQVGCGGGWGDCDD